MVTGLLFSLMVMPSFLSRKSSAFPFFSYLSSSISIEQLSKSHSRPFRSSLFYERKSPYEHEHILERIRNRTFDFSTVYDGVHPTPGNNIWASKKTHHPVIYILQGGDIQRISVIKWASIVQSSKAYYRDGILYGVP